MLKNSKLISETNENYHVELPSGHRMSLDKKGLNPKAHEIILSMKKQNFADGGEVQASSMNDVGPSNNFGAGVDPNADQAYSNNQNQIPVQAPMAGSEIRQSTPVQAAPQTPMSNANAAFEQEKKAQQGVADVIGQQGATEAKDISGISNKIQAMPTQQDVFKKYQESDDALKKAYDAKVIDPDRYWKDKSTGSKIASGIGMILGGFGAVAGQENMAVKMIQNSIDRDIDAQKADQSKSLNLWKMNQEKYGNEAAANLATQNQLYTGLKYKLEQAASQFKGPMAQQQAQMGIALINQKQADNNFKLSLMNSGDGDPAMKVQFLVPPEKQKEVFDEIKNAQDTKRVAPQILEAFDNAANQKHIVDVVPGMQNVDQKNFMGLINTTVKDLEGTARQAAFDSIEHNMLPQSFDDANTIKTKRKLVEDYILSKSSAPVAKGFGIDLSKHQSTAPIQQTQEIKSMNGASYKKVPGGWEKVK